MAELTDLEQVRLFADEPTEADGITDDFINQLLETYSINAATAIVWRAKAGRFARKTTTQTAQTRLELSDKFKHAMEMYHMYADLAGEVLGDEGSGDWEEVEMAPAEGPYPANEPQSMDAYWPGYGRQWPNRLSGTRYPLV